MKCVANKINQTFLVNLYQSTKYSVSDVGQYKPNSTSFARSQRKNICCLLTSVLDVFGQTDVEFELQKYNRRRLTTI